MDIGQFWTVDGLFFAKKGQHYPAGLRSRITVPSQRSCWESAALIELAGRIGLHLTNLSLPIVDQLFSFDRLDQMSDRSDQRFHVLVGHELAWLAQFLDEQDLKRLQTIREQPGEQRGLICQIQRGDRSMIVITGTSPQMVLHAARSLVSDNFGNTEGDGQHMQIRNIPWQRLLPQTRRQPSKSSSGFSLHSLFTTDGVYEQREEELHPTLDLCFEVNDAAEEATIACVELAARLALSAGYVCFPLTDCGEEKAENQRFHISIGNAANNPAAEATLVEEHKLRIVAKPGELLPFVRELIAEWFVPLDVLAEGTWRHRFAALQSPHPDIRRRAELGLQMFAKLSGSEIKQVNVPEHLGKPVELWQRLAGAKMSDGSVKLQVEQAKPVWTANWQDNGELAEIEQYLLAVWTEPGMDEVHNKAWQIEVTTTVSEPTFAKWAEQLADRLQKIAGVTVSFVYRDANKAGLNWALQDVLPQLKQLPKIESVVLQARAFRPQVRHLELIQRFLQELYPLDAILSRELALPLENIHLQLAEEETAPMFRIAARDKQGELLAEWQWEGWVASQPYMPGQESRGYVLVPYSGCRIYEAGQKREKAGRRFATNPYRFWRWYQQTVLPEVISRSGFVAGVPKFLRLDCHVWMDAADRKIPYLEETSSTLEALHEDIYFYTLHLLHDYGKKQEDDGWDAPGGILPFMHHEPDGQPRAEVALYALPTDHRITLIDCQQQELIVHPSEQAVWDGARVVSMSRVDGQRRFVVAGVKDHASATMCEQWLSSAGTVRRNGSYAAKTLPEKSLDEDVFVNEDVRQWLENRRESLPGELVPLDFSFNGEPIWLVELFADSGSDQIIASRLKHALYKPTLFINERHHANEVSSTNAALQLIEQFRQAPALLDRLNLVLIPLENVDGADLHAVMAAEHPCWKHHAARYNACGLEFAKYRFQEDVPFGESRAYPKVWQRWAPDIVLDDHGVPSHEWIQPFSGYNSPPRFPVSYWIPSARMYTIWRELTTYTDEQRAAYQSLRSFLTLRLQADPAVAMDNERWLYTYTRWGNQFDPQHFPIELSNGSIAYTRHSPANSQSHELIERFGKWMTADLMTEVNDETVYGAELAACKHAHLVVQQAILDWIKSRPTQVKIVRNVMADGRVRIGLERKRPL
ncbi:M14 family metallopeptidase [Brevibacillus fulvus]|uniref:Peptidase M14 domain-containing protein n=1 Tax=Brevibacillus fulvus TaxID=1125967 RepID=A0A938XW88_9BACL|nr:M14 family metallopeptidase [Brevibacillus fulvus]MBM7588860.1 hypothetical protein [Brevibacillus fulvus]